MAQYFYLDSNNRQSGPVDAGQLTRYGVTKDTHVWTEGMSQWQPAGSVPELAGLFPSAVAPPQMAPPPPPVRPQVIPPVAPKAKPLLRMPAMIALAAVAAIVLSLLFIPLSALLASLLNANPYLLPNVVMIITGILAVLCLIIRKYRKLLNFCLLLPVLLSAAFGSFYYYNQHANAFHNGVCEVHDYSHHGGTRGIINRFGIQIIPCGYYWFRYEPGVIIGIQEDYDAYKDDYYDLKGNFLYTKEKPKLTRGW
jgi:hypothetical protein